MTTKKHEPKSQAEKFRDLARELGTDKSEASFNEKLNKIVRQKPATEKTKKKPSK